ncbi:MAG TPA: hypothetical protein H9892_00580 [Candidatus Protoclostridium stercorigallinarum]|uniref:ECF transporter S component n=1 Tax=Candidatus Protoclostridium stercorigallinarum TaxID=2838741 RepID=A0A9D1PXY6_9FIRM|nr:hypothetical protein [Candidatus Protoclostridium stercorigallinarum]
MIENILTSHNVSVRAKVTVKTFIAAALVALAVALPQIVHIAAGAEGGMTWLPMYLPVLLAGCLLGVRWGLGTGIASPLVSFLITSLAGSPMPAAARLPFMIAELAVFALVSGAFSRKIYASGWMAFPAVLLAATAGRTFFLLLAVIFQGVAPFTPALVWSQIQSGFIGLLLQALLVPAIVMILRKVLVKRF